MWCFLVWKSSKTSGTVWKLPDLSRIHWEGRGRLIETNHTPWMSTQHSIFIWKPMSFARPVCLNFLLCCCCVFYPGQPETKALLHDFVYVHLFTCVCTYYTGFYAEGKRGKKGSEGEDTETPPPPHPRGGGRPTPGEKKKREEFASLSSAYGVPPECTYVHTASKQHTAQSIGRWRERGKGEGGKEVRGREGKR